MRGPGASATDKNVEIAVEEARNLRESSTSFERNSNGSAHSHRCPSDGSNRKGRGHQGTPVVLMRLVLLQINISLKNDESIPVRSNKKTGAKSKKEVREKVCSLCAQIP